MGERFGQLDEIEDELDAQVSAAAALQHRRITPEQKLLAGMLERCVRDLAGEDTNATTQRDADEWQRWMLDDEEYDDWPFSFRNLCSWLRVDPETMREEMTRQVARMQAARRAQEASRRRADMHATARKAG